MDCLVKGQRRQHTNSRHQIYQKVSHRKLRIPVTVLQVHSSTPAPFISRIRAVNKAGRHRGNSFKDTWKDSVRTRCPALQAAEPQQLDHAASPGQLRGLQQLLRCLTAQRHKTGRAQHYALAPHITAKLLIQDQYYSLCS